MSYLAQGNLSHLVSTYGYGAVGAIVGLESAAVPLPGEATLIAAAIVAGTSDVLDIRLVIAAAATGAIIGDNFGYWVGSRIGYRLLLRFGRYIHLTERRIKVGQYLFLRYGAHVVFFGRFVAVLRPLAAFLAGANRMPWGRFFLYNAAGGIAWAALYGSAGYFLGHDAHRLAGPVAVSIGAAAVIALVIAVTLLRRHERDLEAEAEAALPGALRPPPKVTATRDARRRTLP
jgi:membrane protein DedA with SNARE-associated domain